MYDDFLDARADRAVHVGNSFATDVPGAYAAGVRSVWLDAAGVPDPDPRPDDTVRSFHEVCERPWRA